jgi:DNA polymerase-1
MKQQFFSLEPEAPTSAGSFPDLLHVRHMALDCETDGKNVFKNKPVGVSIAFRTEGASIKKYYLPFGHISGNLDPDKVRSYLNAELVGKEIVFANAKFDIHMLRNFGVDLEALGVKPRDVAFGAALLDDNRRAGLDLDSLSKQFSPIQKMKFNGDMNRMANYPAELVAAYARQDAEVTLLCEEGMQPAIEQQGLGTVLELENDLIYYVCEIERNGARLDIETLERWRAEVRNEYEQIMRSLYAETWFLINPNSGDSLERLCHTIGINLPALKTTKGKSSFTGVELESMKHPLIKKVVRARRLESLLSKFLDKFHEGLDGDVIRSQFHQLKSDEFGTISGRFSSSGGGDSASGYDHNAQQVIKVSKQRKELGDHHIIRELFIPDDGAEYWACDASQIEYRLFGHFAAAPNVIKAYAENPNTDFHQLVTDMVQPYAPGAIRDDIKNVNFARLYVAGINKIAAMLGTKRNAAEEFLRKYDRIFPEAAAFSSAMIRQAETQGYVTTLLGRRARFDLRNHNQPKGAKLHSACNRVIQGSAADIMKLKLRRLYRERKTLGITKLRQMVHDEQCGDKDPDPKYTKLIQECFNEQEMKLKIPILWDLKTGRNWRECK